MTKEELDKLYYNENPLAWLGIAERNGYVEFAVIRILTDAPEYTDDAIDVYRQHFGELKTNELLADLGVID